MSVTEIFRLSLSPLLSSGPLRNSNPLWGLYFYFMFVCVFMNINVCVLLSFFFIIYLTCSSHTHTHFSITTFSKDSLFFLHTYSLSYTHTHAPTHSGMAEITGPRTESACSRSPFIYIFAGVLFLPFFLHYVWARRTDRHMDTDAHKSSGTYIYTYIHAEI